MGRVGAEETAAIGSKLFRGDDRRYRSSGDVLRLRGARIGSAHRADFDGGGMGLAVHRHRHSAGHQQGGHDQRQRQE